MNENKIYFENLNGLRFIAFLSVFIGHTFAFSRLKIDSHIGNRIVGHFLMHGDLGVNFFFVLSGFLITFLLLKEKLEYHTISLKNFYIRRILRIWPVYFLTVVIGFLIIPTAYKEANHVYLPFDIDIPLIKLKYYLSFTANYDMIYNGVNYLLVVVLWSISVEEQFYLTWPLINKITHNFFFPVILFLLLIISFYYRWNYYYDGSIIKYSTISVMNDLVIGSVIALFSFKYSAFKEFFLRMKSWIIISIYILFFVCLPMRGFIFLFSVNMHRFLVSIEPLLFSLFFAFIILEQNYARNSFYKICRIKFLDYLGTISYGLYCYHMIAIFSCSFLFNLLFDKKVESSFSIFILQSTFSLLLTIFFGHLSYKYFETPFLKLKSKYAV
jgi:peptidoglycan/LPS O-acetylase OafA/YrhL